MTADAPTPQPSVATLATPTPRSSRAIAPDVARGLVLLGIAVANVPFFLYADPIGIAFKPQSGESADDWTNAIVALLADNRSYPLFALLFGYGMTQLFLREHHRGAEWTATRGMLVRRSLLLIAFGAVHGILLFFGDILGMYGLLGLALVLLMRASTRTLTIVGWICFAVLCFTALAEGFTGLLGEFGPAIGIDPTQTGTLLFGSVSAATFGEAVLLRAFEWTLALLSVPFGGFGLLAPMILGMIAARHRVLEDPAPHRARLTRIALIALPVSVLGALPLVLALAGVISVGPWVEPVVTLVHGATGPVGAVAYLAIIALVVGTRRGPIARVLAALGQRSLTGYLLQSLVFVIVFAPYTLGLGATAGPAVATQVAVLTWIGTLILANVLAAADKPGPAEWLLRRLAYRRR